MNTEVFFQVKPESKLLTVADWLTDQQLHRSFLAFVGHHWERLSSLHVTNENQHYRMELTVHWGTHRHLIVLSEAEYEATPAIVSRTTVAKVRPTAARLALLQIFNTTSEDQNFSIHSESRTPLELIGCQKLVTRPHEQIFTNLIIGLAQVAERIEVSALIGSNAQPPKF